MSIFVSQQSGKLITDYAIIRIQELINSNKKHINKNILPTIEKELGLDKHDVYYLARLGEIEYIRMLRSSEDKKILVDELSYMLATSDTFLTNSELAKAFKISKRYVGDLITKNKIKRKVEFGKVLTDVTLEGIKEYFKQNPKSSYRKMSKYFKCSPQTLIRRVKEGNDLQLHNRIVKNGRNPHWRGVECLV